MKMKRRFASVDRCGEITTFALTQRIIATISFPLAEMMQHRILASENAFQERQVLPLQIVKSSTMKISHCKNRSPNL